MRLATTEQAKKIDLVSQKEYALSGEILMESAGGLAAREIDLAFLPELTRGQVGVVCGPGNNGGDGLVVARHLYSAGHRDLTVFLQAESSQQTELFRAQKQRCEAQGIRFVDLNAQPERVAQLHKCELIVDALFGIGLNRKIENAYLKTVEAMNASKAPKVSIDCPSGLNCDSGRVEGACVNASQTITFGLAKTGFFVGEGPAHVGRLRILPIGFPIEVLRGVATTHFLFNEKLTKRYLPLRRDNANKSDFGHLLVAAGRPGFWGAGVLSSFAAFRVGAGYVTWGSFDSPEPALREIPEVLTANLSHDEIWNKKISAVAVGPGLGVSEKTAEFIETLKSRQLSAVVVDADAITACVDYKLFPLPKSWIITPHTGELSRVLKTHAVDIEKDRFAALKAATDVAGCHVLLKGFRSLIGFEGRCMVIQAGNAALAKAGTGDVLTGMIGGLLAQGLDTLQGAATAAYLHGRLAEEWMRSGMDKSSLTASDLAQLLPQVIHRVRHGGWMS